jgi:hypothetical protein
MLRKRLLALAIAGGSVLGFAAAAPADAHGTLVDIEVEDNQLVLLSGITAGVAANVCGVEVDAIQAFVFDAGQEVECRALTEQRGQRTVITQH